MFEISHWTRLRFIGNALHGCVAAIIARAFLQRWFERRSGPDARVARAQPRAPFRIYLGR